MPDYQFWVKVGLKLFSTPHIRIAATTLERVLQRQVVLKPLSIIYQTLLFTEEKKELTCYYKWAQDIGDLDHDKWGEILRHLLTSTISSRDKLIQIKFIHRSYWTPERLHRMNPARDSCCSCGAGPQAHGFILYGRVPGTGTYNSVALLGLTKGKVTSVDGRILLRLLMYYAKKQIILKWNRGDIPTMAEWKAAVNKDIPYYKATYLSRGCMDKFINIWMLWVLNIETNSPHVF
ncbi:hypothetical protein XELAEV_18031871mg [Xenopus laevis]|uniref:Uncharacterized protein n=1 Tax=Xenopus laevis TaxID=8355 RepID=A0A974HG51_XENLA|nr:hypothetical protein XELAEV_18031871mg [Xenopus laevis]